MNRRNLLSIAFLIVGIPGCLGTKENRDHGDWDEGTPLVVVSVEEDFDDEAVLKVDCREDDFIVEPGEEVSIDRKEDGEECSFRLYIREEQVDEGTVFPAEKYYLTVTEDGEVKLRKAII